MFCPECGRDAIVSGVDACPACGYEMDDTSLAKLVCERCDMRYWVVDGQQDAADTCPRCGESIRDDDPERAAAEAEIEAERRLDERRERHFDRHGHFGPGHDPGPD